MTPELFELVTWNDIKAGDHVWYMGNVMLIRDGEWSEYYSPDGKQYPFRPGTRRVPVQDETGNEYAPPVELTDRIPRLIPPRENMRNTFLAGVADAIQDRDTGFAIPLILLGESLYDDRYFDGYTSQWFPLPGGLISCGNRKDLPKKQRIHDWMCLGFDTMNKGEKGICEVLVFACTRCGRDWRG